MIRTPPVVILAIVLCSTFIAGPAGPTALGQTTPGQTPTPNPPPKKKKPVPVRTPVRRKPTSPAKPASNANADERTFWESIKDSKSAADFRAYLHKYGENGKFSELAHNRLTELETASKPADLERPVTANNSGGTPAPGTPWRSQQGIDFVYVPAGSFDMGQTNGEADEKPVHRVTISQGFYLGKYEVTQAQWKAVMGVNPSGHQGDDLPVENVSWDDAQEFIRLLNAQSGASDYRLPTEAEWEYSCLAGNFDPYGSDLDAMAWYKDNSGNATHAVGQKRPNAWGLYDMHGNVWEWVQDRFSKDYYASSPATDPKGPASGSFRVARGGAFGNLAFNLWSKFRYSFTSHYSAGYIGFRLARSP